MSNQFETATLAGGCFWCLEAVYDEAKGVLSVESGYSNGHVANPSYRDVCNGNTGHAEVIQIKFDPSIISFRDLLNVFFTIHDPTTLNRQGADVGTQYRSTREANDPWAIITHAVRITCVYEERAQGLLCSVHQARRAHVSAFHDPERFSERDTALTDYHPAFHSTDSLPSDFETEPREGVGSAQACMSAGSAAEDAIAMLCLLDWPPDAARASVEHVCGALMRAGTRQSAFEALRRDRHARALLDLPHRSWTVLLKALLGHPHPAYAATSSGRGVLLRLLLGETLDLLLRDDDLILALALAAPRGGGGEAT